jgi:hypothetical protein
MTDRKQSRGRDLAANDPARPGPEGYDALDLRPRLEALFAKHGMHVAEANELEHGWQYRTYEGPIINIFNTGTVQPQGRRPGLAREFVKELRSEIAELRHRQWLTTVHRGERR